MVVHSLRGAHVSRRESGEGWVAGGGGGLVAALTSPRGRSPDHVSHEVLVSSGCQVVGPPSRCLGTHLPELVCCGALI